MRNGIIIAIGIGAMIGAIFLAIRSTKEECKEEQEEPEKEINKEKESENKKEKGVFDKAAGAVYRYWPTIALSLLAIFCFGFAYRASLKQTAAVITAYKLTKDSYQKYKDKTLEAVGERQEEKIRRAVAKDIANENFEKEKIKPNPKVYETGEGETIFYDVISKRFFKSSFTKMRSIERDLRKLSENEFCIPLNKMYTMIGLKKTSDGKRLGWNSMYNEIRFKYYTGKLVDGEICVVLGFECSPSYDYMELE